MPWARGQGPHFHHPSRWRGLRYQLGAERNEVAEVKGISATHLSKQPSPVSLDRERHLLVHWPRPQKEHLQKLWQRCQSLVHGHEAISTAAAAGCSAWHGKPRFSEMEFAADGCNFKMKDLSNGPALMFSSFPALSCPACTVRTTTR